MSDERKVKLKPPWSGSSATAYIAPDGALELDLYDFSDEAQSSLGNDVAWTWRTPAHEKPRVYESLAAQFGQPVRGDGEMLGLFVLGFENIHKVRDWLRAEGFTVEEKFDGWA